MATPHRSASIDALWRNAKAVWPGMTVYWIGDLAHQTGVSGHNPDDYPRVRAELVDTDVDPEVRALDFMVGPVFTPAEGRRLVRALTTGADKRRVHYVIFESKIYRRSAGFTAEPYFGATHNDHVHVSGHSSDDENGADWTSVLALGEDDMDAATFKAHLAAALNDSVVKARLAAIPLQYPVTPTQSLLALHRETAATVRLVASKVDIDAAELDAIEARFRTVQADLVDRVVAGVLERLPAGALTKGVVEDALRSVLRAGVDAD